ncbi:hypothetical protein [Streptomyces sp. NPDC059909]|uniref:hypothetical protein n=1 Tax=Streptomyces sp. NPDC059909 TaxID=3346998 RepID=UPI0036627C60
MTAGEIELLTAVRTRLDQLTATSGGGGDEDRIRQRLAAMARPVAAPPEAQPRATAAEQAQAQALEASSFTHGLQP